MVVGRAGFSGPCWYQGGGEAVGATLADVADASQSPAQPARRRPSNLDVLVKPIPDFDKC